MGRDEPGSLGAWVGGGQECPRSFLMGWSLIGEGVGEGLGCLGGWKPPLLFCAPLLCEGEGGEGDHFATLLGGLVGEDAGAGDVGGLGGVRVSLAIAAEEFDELVG